MENGSDCAMQMEKDGEAFYRDIAKRTNNAGLQKIFTTLADEEVAHYNTFKKLYEKTTTKVVKSNILEKAKNIFIELKESVSF
ncbi:MAG: rubrerythrin [Desulforhopalus sp.]|jgi:rubrerythrin